MAEPRNASSEGGSRFYTWGNERFPSVTTVLSVINKPALKKWAARSVAEYAVKEQDVWTRLSDKAAIDLLKGEPFRYSDERSDLGTAIHEAVEHYIKKQPLPEYPKDIAPYMRQFEIFLKEWRPRFEMSEASVYKRRFNYAGTLDMLLWIDSELILLDVKSGSIPNPMFNKANFWPEAGLQLNAYARAEFIGLGDNSEHPMPQVAGAGVLSLRPRHYSIFPCDQLKP